MNNRVIVFDNDARNKLAKGADILARAVTSTLGPRSKNVAIDTYPSPTILHDGVSVAKEIKLKDPLEDMGAKLIREASTKTNDLVGDGTTTATLLANEIFQGGLKLIQGGLDDGIIVNKTNAMDIRDRLTLYTDKIDSIIDKFSKKITKKEDRKRVATISAGSEEIGELVTDAFEKVGSDGLVMVEESADFNSSIDYQEGMEFDNGYLSPAFITDPHRMEAKYEGGEHFVLLTDYNIADGMKLVPIVEQVIKEYGNEKALLIIANDVVGSALQALTLTKIRTGAPLIAVMAPEYADRRKQMMEDLAILTGGIVISQESGKKLEDVKISDLGRARSIKVTQTHTVIVPLNPDSEEIKERCNVIKDQIDKEENPVKKESLQLRLSKLSQGVAVIKVGGSSSIEIGDKVERVRDAVYALRAAVTDGIVPGGGVALLKVYKELFGEVMDPVDTMIGEALMSPIKTIIKNVDGDVDLDKLKEGEGFDMITKKIVNMYEAGIIDPAKVTKLAVRHAFSVAGTMLTTACLIADEQDDSVQKIRVVNNT